MEVIELTELEIEELNEKSEENQGIWIQPSNIPTDIKEHVIYMRWVSGRWRGGSYHADSHLYHEKIDDEKPSFKILDAVLKKLYPQISYLEYKQIEDLIHEGWTDYSDGGDWYGNRDEYDNQYIILSELYELLKTF